MKKKLEKKREGTGIDFRTFSGKAGVRYLVFRTGKGSFHVFAEVNAKDAAKDCGADDSPAPGRSEGRNTREMWKSLWEK